MSSSDAARGGTLLAVTLAYMAAVEDRRVSSATLFTSLVDFTDPGDLGVFVDAEQLKAVEERMAEQGYLEGSHMAAAFNMLRPNDLIWSYYVNNYLKGKEPMPFDLLVWNSDSTRMPAANHNFYLRHCYLQNDLSNGRMVLSGKTLDLGRVTIPMYVLSSREDHITAARGVFKGAKCFGGPVRFVTAGSGHIAGVVNPADKPKYQFWTDGPPEGDFEVLARRRQGDAGLVVAGLDKVDRSQVPEKVPARNRQVGQALDAEAARKPTLHRGFRQGGGHERKGQRHSDRALAFALADGERLDGLGGIDQEFVEP